MIFYHGTHSENARKISAEGFLPKKGNTDRLWFSKRKGVALKVAHIRARGRTRPVVLTCDLDLDQLRDTLGAGNVALSHGVLTVRGRIPPEVLRIRSGTVLEPPVPEVRGWNYVKRKKSAVPDADAVSVAAWVNRRCKLKGGRRIGPREPGVRRLTDWMVRRKASRTGRRRVGVEELSERARQWLPHLFPTG